MAEWSINTTPNLFKINYGDKTKSKESKLSRLMKKTKKAKNEKKQRRD